MNKKREKGYRKFLKSAGYSEADIEEAVTAQKEVEGE